MLEIRTMQEQALFCAVAAEDGEQTAAAVVSAAGAPEDNAAWVVGSMQRLEDQFDEAAVKRIRMRCQCGYGMDEKLVLLKELMANASSLAEFANQEKAHSAGLYYKDGGLYLQFFFCPCPMLAQVERLKSRAWCECTTGYSKALFERAFGCEADVELIKSIKAGDEICLMKIIPKGTVNF